MLYSLRVIKIGLVATIALFFSLVAFDNTIDHESNLLFVQHVMSMDTTLHDPTLMQRAITSLQAQTLVYYIIIIWQILTAIICWFGTLALIASIRDNNTLFHESKALAFLGLFSGVMLYLLGFIILGGEWFSMWQSPTWNGQSKSGLFISMIMFVMIFLNTRDGD